jgi:glutamate synthase (NADPH/NADH) small chain
MGDPTGFLNIQRKVAGYRPVEERINDYSEVEVHLPEQERMRQASRCMECGVPFCHWACPVSNVMPDWQDRLFKGDWQGAWEKLEMTNPFPEFTGRVCPALCEASCVLGIHDEPVTIRQNELAVIEKAYELGFVKSRQPIARNGKTIAIIGGGPAGLSAAYYLNRAGFKVTVFEADAKPGGYLRYGIPDFKLDKRFIDRRLMVMEDEGIEFRTSTQIGKSGSMFGSEASIQILPTQEVIDAFDATLITIGARAPRDLILPGREGSGIHQALDFLSLQNRAYCGERNECKDIEPIVAYGKRVVVIGGGDTGADCVGTANRQGARSVTQIELLPKPPEHRSGSEPWPLWPKVLKTSSSHLEGCDRLWSVTTNRFNLTDGLVTSLDCSHVEWIEEGGKLHMQVTPGSEFNIEADLVLLAMGFVHVVQDGLIADLGLELDPRGNIRTAGTFHSSHPKVWASGDARRGASLVVHAIADGRSAAEAMIRSLSLR